MKNKNAAIFAETIDEGENTTAHIKITGDSENLKILVGLIISQLCSVKFLSMLITAVECVYTAHLEQKANVEES